MDQSLVTRIVEAALLAAQQPLGLAQLHGLFPEEQPAPAGSVEQALAQLREDCAMRGVDLVEVASGFRYQVKEEVHGWVARLWTERKTRYTRATLETLALIAYRQPITRGEIEQVRGVSVNSNTIQALEEREWIRVVGHRDVPGRPALLGTTRTFLDYFGLKRLEDLPPLSELKDIGELEPQLFNEDGPLRAGLQAPAGEDRALDAGTGQAAPAGHAAIEGDPDVDLDAGQAGQPDQLAGDDPAADHHDGDDAPATEPAQADASPGTHHESMDESQAAEADALASSEQPK